MRALGQTPQWSVARLFKIISPPFLPFMAAIVASRMAGGASQDPVFAHSTESRSNQGTTIRGGRYGAIDDTRRWRVTAPSPRAMSDSGRSAYDRWSCAADHAAASPFPAPCSRAAGPCAPRGNSTVADSHAGHARSARPVQGCRAHGNTPPNAAMTPERREPVPVAWTLFETTQTRCLAQST